MYLRLRKRKKPLPTEAPAAPGVEPAEGAGEQASPPSSEWVPADSGHEPAEGPDVETTRHPNRGNAHESARGSHN